MISCCEQETFKQVLELPLIVILKQTSTLPPSFSLVTLQRPSGILFYIYGVIVNYLEYLTMMVDDEFGLHQDDDDKDS